MVTRDDVIAVGERAVAPPPGGELHVQLDGPLPETIAVGAGTALFVAGYCFHARSRIRALELVVDGTARPVTAHGMPRIDVFRALHPDVDPYATEGMGHDPDSADDPALHSYASGFWGMARVARSDGDCVVALRATLEDDADAVVELARIPRETLPSPSTLPQRPPAPGPLVAVSMATYEPPRDLFRRQLDSIRAQTHENWVCVISDDCSRPEGFQRLVDDVGGDPRFVISRSPRRLGFYRNFERALALAPAEAEYVAMADQDDEWHPDKLDALLGEIGDAKLAYSDQRIVDRRGELIADTYWSARRNNHSDLLSLLVANAVTGAASLFPRELLDDVLPFPPAQFAHFHDHWIGLVALSLGDVAFVERPLYDYVQHRAATLGHAAANHITGLPARLRGTLRRDPRDRVRQWRLIYFVDVCRLLQFATVLDMRLGDRMPRDKRRALDRFLASDRSLLPLAQLGLRGARELVRRRPETLGAEWMLFHGFAWRRALGRTTRERPQRRFRLDALPPPTLDLKPGRTQPQPGPPRDIAEKISPLELAVREDAPLRVNLLIPTIDIQHFFGGYIAKLNLARRLVERGVRVRIVTVDPVGPLPPSWKQQLQTYRGLEGLFERVEVAFGRESQSFEVSRSDRFIATTWWSAHIAAAAVRELEGERFLYLIQEYEPFTFPMGTYAALAEQSYRFGHVALFSTELLRDYFRRHGIGVFADGAEVGDRRSAAFQNAITPVRPPTADELSARRGRRLLFYARPEPHAARNLFELGVIALGRAAELGAFDGGWELNGIGTVDLGRQLDLGAGISLNLLRRSGQDDYANVLRRHDVGLALMHTPHPSLVPIEMASAGMLTVTSSFENKTHDALAEISSNLLTAEPTVEGVAGVLAEAVAGAEDHERRAAGSHVRWSSDWDKSFDDDLLDAVERFLGA